MEKNKHDLTDSDMRELKQVVFEIKVMFENKTWPVLEELGQELKLRGEAIELFARYKKLTDMQNN